MTHARVPRLRPGGILLAVLAALALAAPPARAAINVPSDGSDGAFNPTSNVEIDLSQAVTGHWNDNNAANAGKGVYDPEKWAVVFKYSSVNIPAGVTVTFKNHSPNAPVVWLVQGDVTIAGTVDVSGKPASSPVIVAEGGPGGFGSGTAPVGSVPGSAGRGPGGAPYRFTAMASYGTKGNDAFPLGPTYGSAPIIPLIGGSGNSYGYNLDWGAGGGAILIAATNTIFLSGKVNANGGGTIYNTGTGGGIRLLADTLNASVNSLVQAIGLTSGNGRIRIEMNHGSFAGVSAPAASFALPGGTPVIWPTAAQPTLVVTKVGDTVAPSDPAARLDFPNQDVSLSGAAPVVVTLQASNVPLDWKVYVRVVPRNGPDYTADATLVGGDAASSVWQATITPAQGFTAIQARAYKP